MAKEGRAKYGNSAVSDNVDFAIRVDAVGATTYVGYAKPGSSTADKVWRIKRLVETGPDLIVTYADGNDYFDNSWDSRLGLTYS